MITRSKAKQQNIQDQQNLTKENNQKTNQQPGNQNNQQTGQTSRGNNQQQPALNPVKTNNKERTDHAGIPTIGEISKCLICCHRSDLFGLGECMHPICMKCSLRIRVFGEKKQCPQCQTDIPILYYVSAPQGQKHLLKLPTNCIDHVEYEAKFSVRFDSKYALECFDSFLDKRRKECVERLNEWVFFDPTKKSKTSIIHGQFKYIFRKNGIWRCSKNPIKVYKCNAYLREFQKNYILCADHTCDLIERWECVDRYAPPNLGMKNSGKRVFMAWADGPGLTVGVLGSPNKFTVGYTKNLGGGKLTVLIDGTKKAEVRTVHHLNENNYQVEYTVQSPGFYTINVNFIGTPILGSPFEVFVNRCSSIPSTSTAIEEQHYDYLPVKDPMFSLPNEVRLDILKCLNFNQLFSQRQTNFYFCNLINKYEEQLAKKKFNRLVTLKLSGNVYRNNDEFIRQSGLFEFTLNDQLRKKWNAALAKSIQLYLEHSIEERPILIRLETIEEDEKNLLLVLPAFPKNIKDLVTLRCWFEHLFGCAFEYPYVGYRFNPELIRLLFDDDETIPHQFLA